MRWNKIKTVMLLLLLCVNIFLVANLAIRYRNTSFLSDEIIKDTVRLLADSGIKLDEAIIPSKKSSTVIYEGGYSSLKYFEETAEKLSRGEECTASLTPNGVKFISNESGDIFEFSETTGFGFTYLKGEAADEDFSIYSEGGLPDTFSPLGVAKRRALKTELEDFMLAQRSSAFSDPEAKSEISIESALYDPSRELYILHCAQTVDDIPISSLEFSAALDSENNSVVWVSGSFIFQRFSNRYKSSLRDQITILFLERDYCERGARSDESLEIVSLTETYCVNWSADRSVFYLLPAWRIEYSDGTVRVRNSLNGSLYSE